MINQMKQDNRKNIRVAPANKQPIRVDINGENFLDILHAQNISMGGIGIVVPHLFKECKVNDDVSFIVKVSDPVDRNIYFSGPIIHLSRTHFGVSFDHITPADRKDLRHYIYHRLQNESFVKKWLFKMGWIR